MGMTQGLRAHRGKWSVSVVGLATTMSLQMFSICAVGDEVVT
jgi:hypothetical protein